jgi:molecular chaperone GrpE
MAGKNTQDPKKREQGNGARRFAEADEKTQETVTQDTAGSLKSAEESVVGETQVPDEDSDGKKAHLSEKEQRKQLRKILGDQECDELLAAHDALKVQEKVLQEKEKLLEEYEDLLKRKQADFENFRKRMQKELEDYRKYANSELVLDILNIIDDFERAIESTKSSRDFDVLLDGIMLVEKQLRNILEKKHGVEKIETVGQEFDPAVHDAVMMEESEDHEEDTVVEAFQSGYRMYERVLRPAKVKVAKAVSADERNKVNEVSESSGKGE